MYNTKIVVIAATWLATLSSVANGDVVPGVIETNDAQGMQNAVYETVQNCQDGLSSAGGGGLTGLLLSVQIVVLLQPLLLSLVLLLVPLLSTVLHLVIELLTVVLCALVKIVNLVIKLLTGVLGQSDYQKQCNQWKNDTDAQIKSYSGTGLDSVVAVVLSLVATIFGLLGNVLVSIRL